MIALFMGRLLFLLFPLLLFGLEQCRLIYSGFSGNLGLLKCRNLHTNSTYRVEIVYGELKKEFVSFRPQKEDHLPFAVPFYWSGNVSLNLYRDGLKVASVPLRVRPLNRGVSKIRLVKSSARTGKTEKETFRIGRKEAYNLIRWTLRTYSPKRFYEDEPLFPLKEYRRFSSPFGVRRLINGHPSGFHKGLDIAAPYGTPVFASLSGKVVLARYLPLTGNTVILDHGWGLMTLYAHLSKIEVKEGQFVRRGEVIGRVGSTGRSTGPHLHFGVYLNDVAVDPQSFLKMKLRPPEEG